MIKFFRKIRYDLMEKNKTGKYFKYAIGEIVLVVIGILIALSINNWNQERIAKIKAYSYLYQINKDLSLDLEYYDSMIKAASIMSEIYDDALKSNMENDSLTTYVGQIITVNYDPVEFGPSYISFVNTGDIELIEEKELLTKLQYYYNSTTTSLNNSTEYQRTFNIHNIEGRLIETLEMEEDGTFSLESLKKEFDFGNLKSLIIWQNMMFKKLINPMEEAKKDAQKLQQLINNLTITKG
jgi:hypothetical protein